MKSVAYCTALWQKFEGGEVTASTVKRQRFRQFIDACQLPVGVEKLAEAYLQGLSGKAYLLPGVIQTLGSLSGICRMALLTNGFSKTQRSRIAISGIADYFDAIVISEEVGFTKPDPRMFEHAAELLGGISKPHTLMIGDSPSSDMQGGSNFGIDTCLIDPDGSLKESTPPPTFRISGIEEIVALLQPSTPGA